MNFPNDKGSYVLVYLLRRQSEIGVGKLGTFEFQRGYYFYCGSAMGSGGLKSRIGRHLKSSDKQFWHIDYFKPIAEVQCVWFTTSSFINECSFVRLLEQGNRIRHLVTVFGASDCKQKCESHLLFLNENKNLDDVFRDLRLHASGLKEEMIVREGLLR